MTGDTKEQAGKSVSSSRLMKDALMLKIVIRCLPPTLNEEEFLKLIEPLSNHDFFCFVKADSSLEQYACSRAYLNFTNQNDVVAFRDKWDGFPFKDTNGREYPAVVELAPYQKIPKKASRKPDTRCGTIEEDEDYKKFLEVLNADVEPLPSAEAYLEELEAKQRAAANARVTTPLIDFLKRKRIERIKARERAREERRQKEKERKRQREEEKRKLDKERKRKREERERREREARAKKDEKSSDGEKKVEEKKFDEKSKEPVKKDTPIKLLKKTDTKTESDAKTKDPGRGNKDADQPTRIKPEMDRKGTEKGRPRDTPTKEKEPSPSASTTSRSTGITPKAIAERRKPSGRDGRDEREGKPERNMKDLKAGRDGRDNRGGRDSREGRDRDGDRYRGDRGTGRDRYSDRRPPLKTSSQESLPRATKTPSKDKVDSRDSPRENPRDRDGRRPSNRDRGETRDGYRERQRDHREERRPVGTGGRQERMVGKGDVRAADRKEGHSSRNTTSSEPLSKDAEKEAEAKREERKMRNRDRRPDMVRYQPGQRSWRNSKKDEGSDSSRASPTSSEGDKPKPEQKKPVTSTLQPGPAPAPAPKKVEEKRPTAAKKFDSQVRSNPGRFPGGREENRGRPDPRPAGPAGPAGPAERTRGVGRGYREERSYRNRQRQGDARKKEGETNTGKGPGNEKKN